MNVKMSINACLHDFYLTIVILAYAIIFYTVLFMISINQLQWIITNPAFWLSIGNRPLVVRAEEIHFSNSKQLQKKTRVFARFQFIWL